MNVKTLFIGGTNDGKWLDIDNKTKSLVVSEEPYIIEHIKSAGVVFTIFRLKSLTGTQAIAKLIRGYKP
jgi:hypothetical protein